MIGHSGLAKADVLWSDRLCEAIGGSGCNTYVFLQRFLRSSMGAWSGNWHRPRVGMEGRLIRVWGLPRGLAADHG